MIFYDAGEAVIFEDTVSSVTATLWVEEATFTDDDWAVLVAQFEVNQGEQGTIEALEVGYLVVQPIPYRIERISDDNYEASFVEANIAIGGTDQQDAYQSLVAEILDTLDSLLEQPALTPAAAAQLDVLRQYIVKT